MSYYDISMCARVSARSEPIATRRNLFVVMRVARNDFGIRNRFSSKIFDRTRSTYYTRHRDLGLGRRINYYYPWRGLCT